MNRHRPPRAPLALLPLLAIAPLGTAGCARIETKAARSRVPAGVRVYPPRVLLLVDADGGRGKGRSALVVVPDLGSAYDVRPTTFLAKNDFRIDVEDGMLRTFASGLDTTPALTFFKGVGEAGAKTAAAAVGVSARDIEGTFGLPTGIYELRRDGRFARVPPPEVGPSPARRSGPADPAKPSPSRPKAPSEE